MRGTGWRSERDQLLLSLKSIVHSFYGKGDPLVGITRSNPVEEGSILIEQ